MIRLFCLLLLLHIATHTVAQKYFIRKIDTHIDQTDILPQVCIKDEKGFFYLGCDKGLYRYDGSHFRKIGNFSKSITALSYFDKRLYIGCLDGSFAELEEEKIIVHKISSKTINCAISNILVSDSGNTILLSTRGQGIILSNGSKTQFINEKNSLSDNYIYSFVRNKGQFWAGTDKGLNKIIFHNDKPLIQSYSTQNGILSDNIVSSIAVSPDNKKICLGFQQGLVTVSDTGILNKSSTLELQKFEQVNDILYENDDYIWLATNSGYLIRISLSKGKLFVADSIKIGAAISKIEKDIVGNIWILTERGLYEVTAPHIQSIALPEGKHYTHQISAIANQYDSVIFYAVQEELYCYNLVRNKLNPIVRLSDIITKIFKDQNDLWIGTLNNGIWRVNIEDKKTEKIEASGSPSKMHILDINISDTNIWIASLEGLFRYRKSTHKKDQISFVQKHLKTEGLGSDYIYQIFIDHNKRVWFATDGAGPAFYDKGKFISWNKKIPGLNSNVVYSIEQDINKGIWLTTLDNGVFLYKDDKWKQFGKNYGLDKGEFAGIGAQGNGHTVFVQSDRIFEYLPEHHFFIEYSKLTGINVDSINTNINLVSKNKEGDILIPRQNGFLCFKTRLLKNSSSSQINIYKIQVFLQDVPMNKHEFNYDQNQISIEFESSNFINTEKLYYRYRLVGLSKEWISTSDKKITYSNLSAGKYIFEVQVAHDVSFEHPNTDRYSFTIAQPFWQTWWFYLLLISSVGYLIRTYVRFRESEIRKFENIQKERMNFEYEQLKSQVNPHFLFNSLNTLVELIDEDSNKASDYTIHLSAMYRTLLSFRNRELISISEEMGLLDHYIFVQKCRFGDALQIQNTIDIAHSKNKKIVPLALQLLVENAIKHNEVSKAKPLTVFISMNDEYIIINNKLSPKISTEKGEGFGISNLQKRYLLLAEKEIIIENKSDHFVVKLPLL